jgi:hypothetical protein
VRPTRGWPKKGGMCHLQTPHCSGHPHTRQRRADPGTRQGANPSGSTNSDAPATAVEE